MTYQGRRRQFKGPIFCVSEPLSLSVLKECAAERGLIFVKRLIFAFETNRWIACYGFSSNFNALIVHGKILLTIFEISLII